MRPLEQTGTRPLEPVVPVGLMVLERFFRYPRDPNHRTSDNDEGVYNHLRNARYLGSMTIVRR